MMRLATTLSRWCTGQGYQSQTRQSLLNQVLSELARDKVCSYGRIYKDFFIPTTRELDSFLASDL